MKDQIKKYLPVLEFAVSLPKKKKNNYLENLQPNIVKFLINLINNIVYRIIPIKDDIIKLLKPLKKILIELVSKNQSLKKRKQILIKNNIVDRVIDPILPILRDIQNA